MDRGRHAWAVAGVNEMGLSCVANIEGGVRWLCRVRAECVEETDRAFARDTDGNGGAEG